MRPNRVPVLAVVLVVLVAGAEWCDVEIAEARHYRIVPIALSDASAAGASVEIVIGGEKQSGTLDSVVRLETPPGTPVDVALQDPNGCSDRRTITPGVHYLVLLPDRWLIEKGPFAGRTVAVPPLVPINQPDGVSLVSQPLRLWRRTSIPVMVEGLDDRRMRSRVEEAVSSINHSVGIKLLDLAVDSDQTLSDSFGIYFSTPPKSPESAGEADLGTPECRLSPDHGFQCVPYWQDQVEVRIADHAGVEEVQHELGHALGLSHSCVIPSVMATEFEPTQLASCAHARDRYGYDEPLLLAREISQFDVAALQILHEVAARIGGERGDELHWFIVSGSGRSCG